MSEQEIREGNAAKRLLEDETLDKAFKDVKQAIFEAIERCPIRDTEGLHELRLMLKLLVDVRSNLESAVEAGHLAFIRINGEPLQETFLGDLNERRRKRANR